jgi:hypothetical protein
MELIKGLKLEVIDQEDKTYILFISAINGAIDFLLKVSVVSL